RRQRRVDAALYVRVRANKIRLHRVNRRALGDARNAALPRRSGNGTAANRAAVTAIAAGGEVSLERAVRKQERAEIINRAAERRAAVAAAGAAAALERSVAAVAAFAAIATGHRVREEAAFVGGDVAETIDRAAESILARAAARAAF